MNIVRKQRVLKFADYILKNNATVRQTACALGMSKSTVHNDVCHELYKIDFYKFLKVKAVLFNNFKNKHINGGNAMAYKFKIKNY